MTKHKISSKFRAPFLKSLSFRKEAWSRSDVYPFNLPILKGGSIEIAFRKPVTIFIGENGTGKSTLLEAIAHQCGFNPSGGSRNHAYDSESNEAARALNESMRLGWLPRVTKGFFMRAESFSEFAKYVDELAKADPGLLEAYGGKSLQGQSHGESFLSLFQNRFGEGIYILDEPEAALSPSRQLTFLTILRDMEKTGRAQILIATHSPILMSYPDAELLQLDETGIHEIDDLASTSHFQITKDFLNSPERYLKHLFDDSSSDT